MRPGASLIVAGLLAITLSAPPALAAGRSDRAKVRRYKQRAFRLFAKGRYADGIEQMEAAHRLIPHPGFLLNIALAYDRWEDHCPEALETFERFYEACGGSCDLLDEATAKRAAVIAKCEVEVRVASAPPGAEIRVDGAPKGRAPLSARLLPGAHEFTAELPGHQAARRRVTVSKAAPPDVLLRLEPIPAAAPPPPAPPPMIRAELRAKRDEGGLAPWTWSAFGAAAAGAAVGAVFTVRTLDALDAEEAARASRRPRGEVESLQQAAIDDAIVANVGFGVAAAGLVTGVVLIIVDAAGGDDPAPLDATLTPAIGPRGVGLAGRF